MRHRWPPCQISGHLFRIRFTPQSVTRRTSNKTNDRPCNNSDNGDSRRYSRASLTVNFACPSFSFRLFFCRVVSFSFAASFARTCSWVCVSVSRVGLDEWLTNKTDTQRNSQLSEMAKRRANAVVERELGRPIGDGPFHRAGRLIRACLRPCPPAQSADESMVAIRHKPETLRSRTLVSV